MLVNNKHLEWSVLGR